MLKTNSKKARENIRKYIIDNFNCSNMEGLTMTITTNTTYGEARTYEVAEKMQHGEVVWNIGANMGNDDYIPICRMLRPGCKDDYNIDPASVKAIRLPREDVKALRAAASVGVNSLETARKALASKRRGYWADRKRAAAESTIDIFQRISA